MLYPAHYVLPAHQDFFLTLPMASASLFPILPAISTAAIDDNVASEQLVLQDISATGVEKPHSEAKEENDKAVLFFYYSRW